MVEAMAVKARVVPCQLAPNGLAALLVATGNREAEALLEGDRLAHIAHPEAGNNRWSQSRHV
jgi:hypothetical protein